jgi:hypothetical protein
LDRREALTRCVMWAAQVHFFTSPEPGKLFGRINWRVSRPNGAWRRQRNARAQPAFRCYC